MNRKLLDLSHLPQPCLKCIKDLTSYKRIFSMREISLIINLGTRWERRKVLACIFAMFSWEILKYLFLSLMYNSLQLLLLDTIFVHKKSFFLLIFNFCL